MTEVELVNFYEGILKLKPALVELPQADLFERLGQIVQIVHGIGPTRDHMRMAVAKFNHTRVKRRWDAKFNYGVKIFLRSPNTTIAAAHRTLENLFNQRTRPAVVQSMKDEAEVFRKETPDEIESFCAGVDEAYQKKSADQNFLV